MFSLDTLRALYEYNEWANTHVLDAAAGLNDAELGRDLGASFGSARGNLVHQVGAQIVWLTRWAGEKSEAYALVAEQPGLDTIRQAFQISHDDLRRFIDSISEADLEGDRPYRDGEGQLRERPLWQLMLQVANHGTHHRAETALMLTTLGRPPRQLDYLFFELERNPPA